MRNTWLIRQIAALTLATVALAGCTFPHPLRISGITPTATSLQNPHNRFFQAICVEPGQKFHGIVYGYTVIVSPKTMQTALQEGLIGNDMLAAPSACRYILKAQLVHIGYDLIGMPFSPLTMSSSVHYELRHANSGTKLYDSTLTLHYTHNYVIDFPASLAADETYDQTVNGVVRTNLQRFINGLR